MGLTPHPPIPLLRQHSLLWDIFVSTEVFRFRQGIGNRIILLLGFKNQTSFILSCLNRKNTVLCISTNFITVHDFALISHFFYKKPSFSYILKYYLFSLGCKIWLKRVWNVLRHHASAVRGKVQSHIAFFAVHVMVLWLNLYHHHNWNKITPYELLENWNELGQRMTNWSNFKVVFFEYRW